eukprot:TRINITY_DN1478_c0_g1_i10.p1 TRINITY_DN1478_c0_g1~~TRINITY_DN1478_c0_g1_i10.p1  ORF type:complete len:939 (-),score=226.57 TRINITY_DN1478_c0_g1_i10:178-2994(-)
MLKMGAWSRSVALFMISWAVISTFALPRTDPPPRYGADNPVANPKAVVVVGTARFTVLTARLIRMEWTSDGAFEDAASATFTNRNLPVPQFTSGSSNGVFTLTTSALSLTYNYVSGSPEFTPDNLRVQLLGQDGLTGSWAPNTTNTGNLLGTLRTLDGVNGAINLNCTQLNNPSLHCTFGLISTLGWSLVDDSSNALFTPAVSGQWQWMQARAQASGDIDWYFFGHGLNFRLALNEFTLVAGQIPLPPRFAFGIWWSRYWAYSDIELMELVSEYEIHDTPLDVLVTDMDWHITFYKEAYQGKKDQAGQTIGWTGFTWDDNLFPNPQAFLQYCKSKGLHNTLNLHPASGVQPWEERYPQMAKASGIDPNSQKYVPLQLANQTAMSLLYDVMLRPLQEEGIDFWWLDWQQGENWPVLPGLNPTFILNYIFFTYPGQWQNGRRPLLFHRWGGLGNHRYQIGFSGDVVPAWGSLNFQPYFTATAANVGFGYWSHDLGGHTLPETPELYTRWVQWGAFSPIFRTHCTKAADNERRIWAFPLEYFFIMRDAIQLRASLVPYIYTAARNAHNTGVAFLHPLYYDWANLKEAYSFPTEYVYGDDLVVAPVTHFINNATGLAPNNVWVPPGQWVEWFSGKIWTGPQTLGRSFAIDDIPVFVKAGSIIPQTPTGSVPLTGSAQLIPPVLGFTVFATPNISSSTTNVYEDDGDTTSYLTNQYAWTTATFTQTANQVSLVINAVNKTSTFTTFPAQRSFQVTFSNVFPPSSVSFNGANVPYDAFGEALPSWKYDGETLSLIVSTPSVPTNKANTVVALGSKSDPSLLNGFILQVRRASTIKTLLDQSFPAVFQEDYEAVIDAAGAGFRITSNPASARSELAAYPALFAQAIKQIQGLSNLNANIRAQAASLMSDAMALSSASSEHAPFPQLADHNQPAQQKMHIPIVKDL